MGHRQAVYVSSERHWALKTAALANGVTLEAYVEKLLQMVQPLGEQHKIIEA